MYIKGMIVGLFLTISTSCSDQTITKLGSYFMDTGNDKLLMFLGVIFILTLIGYIDSKIK